MLSSWGIRGRGNDGGGGGEVRGCASEEAEWWRSWPGVSAVVSSDNEQPLALCNLLKECLFSLAAT